MAATDWALTRPYCVEISLRCSATKPSSAEVVEVEEQQAPVVGQREGDLEIARRVSSSSSIRELRDALQDLLARRSRLREPGDVALSDGMVALAEQDLIHAPSVHRRSTRRPRPPGAVPPC